jgi:hypothetical protein
MIRWIAFDDETAEAIMSRYRRGAAEIRTGQPLDAALALRQPSLLVLPSSTPGRVLLAHCTPKADARSVTTMPPAAAIAEPTFTRRQPPQASAAPKRWWQRLGA